MTNRNDLKFRISNGHLYKFCKACLDKTLRVFFSDFISGISNMIISAY